MKTMTEIRLTNLKRIADKYESQREFADALDTSPAYLNHLLTGYRTIGEKTARKFEEKLRLPALSLDTASDQEIPVKEEPQELTERQKAFLSLIESLPSAEQDRLFRELEEKERYFNEIYEDLKSKKAG